MNPKKALYFSVFIRVMVVLFCISLGFVKLIESDDETKQGVAEKEKKELVLAIQQADIQRCKALLIKGVQTNGVLEDGSTPLHLAALNSAGDKSFGFFKDLLCSFADTQVRDAKGRLPIHVACINTKNIPTRDTMIGLLLLAGSNSNSSNINEKNGAGRSCLGDVVSLRSISGTRDFMEHWGALCTDQTIEEAKELAGGQAGKGLGDTDQWNEVSKKYSIEECSLKNDMPVVVLKLLKEQDREVMNYLDTHKEACCLELGEQYLKMPFVHVAIMQGKKEMIEYMLNNGAASAKDSYGRTVLHMLCGCKSLSADEKMYLMGVAISKGAKFVGDKLKNTPLHVAVTGRDAHLVKELVATFRDNMYTEGKNKNDDRPIDIATRYGMTEIVRILSA